MGQKHSKSLYFKQSKLYDDEEEKYQDQHENDPEIRNRSKSTKINK